jgi:hypothetical protein
MEPVDEAEELAERVLGGCVRQAVLLSADLSELSVDVVAYAR